jgi:hypothetical protein
MSNQYLAKSMWKYASFHMVLGIWFHTHTWNQNWMVTISSKLKKDILLTPYLYIPCQTGITQNTMWKCTTFHIVLCIWFHADTWNHIGMVKIR